MVSRLKNWNFCTFWFPIRTSFFNTHRESRFWEVHHFVFRPMDTFRTLTCEKLCCSIISRESETKFPTFARVPRCLSSTNFHIVPLNFVNYKLPSFSTYTLFTYLILLQFWSPFLISKKCLWWSILTYNFP